MIYSEEQQALIFSLNWSEESKENFVQKFGIAREKIPMHVTEHLLAAYKEKSPDDIEAAMNLGFNFGFEEQAFSVIPKLLIENWHFRHEDVASSLQDYHEQAGPEAIENLYTAAITKFDYLAFDEACALAVKCTWALGAIGYGEAVSKLKLLSKIENEVIAKAASYQLDRLEKS